MYLPHRLRAARWADGADGPGRESLFSANTVVIGTQGTVNLNGGSILSTGSVNITQTGQSITASGGALTLGDAGVADGFIFAGSLNTGGQQVVLLSAGWAQLGAGTTLSTVARLSAVNGASLGGGQTLRFTGDASVDGSFRHNGTISSSGGTLPSWMTSAARAALPATSSSRALTTPATAL